MFNKTFNYRVKSKDKGTNSFANHLCLFLVFI